MGFPTDAPQKSKTGFKKRALRPWKPTVLEGTDDVLFEANSKLEEKQVELLQRELESTLELKKREHQDLHQSIASLADHRITLGGFLRPKDILLPTDFSSLNKTASLMTELKAKEKEIFDITQNLKITQSEELAKRAESARLIEEKARQAAEEKAIFALRQAQQVSEQCKAYEDHVYVLEQVKTKLELALQELEKKLKLTHHELEVSEQRINTEIEQRQKVEYTAIEQYNWFDNEIKNLNEKLQQEYNIKNQLESTVSNLTKDLEVETEERMRVEEDFKNILFQKNEIEMELKDQKDASQTLERNLLALEERAEVLEAEKAKFLISIKNSEEQEIFLKNKANKMAEIIHKERNLRHLYEENLEKARMQIEKLELRRRAESEARKLAEEKAKFTFEQAGKAMLQMQHAYEKMS